MSDTLLPTALVDRARDVVEANRAAGRRIAVAESCTGGLVSAAITEIPGASDVFFGGFVTYSNESKIDLLGVRIATLEAHGAVSERVAWEMAAGALKHSPAALSLAVTGIAGPAGGSAKKPVGTVWIGWGYRKLGRVRIHATRFRFRGGRDAVRRHAVRAALEGLLES